MRVMKKIAFAAKKALALTSASSFFAHASSSGSLKNADAI